MARVKQEVKEQRAAQQQQRQAQHQSPMSAIQSPPIVGAPGVTALSTPPARRISANVFSSGCIDLTLDDDTEDEEEADEPLGQVATPSPSAAKPVHAEQLPEQTKEQEQTSEPEQEHKQEPEEKPEAVPIEQTVVDAETDTDTDEDMEIEIEAEQGANQKQSVDKELPTQQLSTVQQPATDQRPPFPVQSHLFVMSDVESDEDDELPVRRPSVEVEPARAPASATQSAVFGVKAAVQKIGSVFSSMLPSFSTAAVAMKGATQEGDGDEEDEDDEEEDEALPALYTPPDATTPERAATAPGSPFSDDGSPMDIDHGGSDASPLPRDDADADIDGDSDAAEGGTVAGDMEDGEVYEEGAVIKSPTAVRLAIAQELQASKAAAKRKQKKRGRKRNKRKAEVLLQDPVAPDTVDAFGRNVRRHVGGEASPIAEISSIHTGPGTPPVVALLPTPAHTPVPPPLAHAPPPQPPGDFAMPRGASLPFVDEHIVRVNRDGSVEPFSLHRVHGNDRPLHPPLPLVPPPPLPMGGGGFRYVPVDHFSMPPAPGAVMMNRGFKRPLPRPPVGDSGPAEMDTIDLASLRAAALRTKRKTPAKETLRDDDPRAVPPLAASTASPADEQQKEEKNDGDDDSSLDALRAALLKSMKPRKRQTVSSGSGSSPANSSSPPQQPSTNPASKSAPPSDPPTPAPVLKPSASLSLAGTETNAPPFPESPLFRPLTAASQSIVIRLSLDDLRAKGRTNSFEDETATTKYGRVVDEVRARASSSASELQPTKKSTSRENGTTATTGKSSSPANKKPPLSPTKSSRVSPQKQQAQVTANAETRAENRPPATNPDAAKPAKPSSAETAPGPAPAPGLASAGPASAPVAAVVVTPLDEEILRNPVKLEAERVACVASIREADAQISRLDAEIAALRRVLATKEAAGDACASCATSPSPASSSSAVASMTTAGGE